MKIASPPKLAFTDYTYSGLPKLLGREPRAFRHGPKLGPDHSRMNLGLIRRLRRETTVDAGNHILAPHQPGEAHDALGDQLRMLHNVAGMSDHARDNHLAIRQLHAFPHMIFVLVARVCG